jgi:hypothetical protein
MLLVDGGKSAMSLGAAGHIGGADNLLTDVPAIFTRRAAQTAARQMDPQARAHPTLSHNIVV